MTKSPVLLLSLAAWTALSAPAQTTNGEWRYYSGELRGTKYSALDQINASNVKNLQLAWRWKAANFSQRPDTNWEVTPIVVGNVMYFTAGLRRDAIAVDATTGETLWMYRLDDSARGAVRTVNRGLSYWTDGRGDQRIVLISPGYQLIALNAKTGEPIPGFGKSGLVDLFVGLDRDAVRPGTIGSTAPPIITKDVIVVGAALEAGTVPRSKANVPGYIRGYDVHTGKLLWTFHTVPKAGEAGVETWLDDAWQFTGNTGSWGGMSADEDLGYVYVPIEGATGDVYGGHRPGQNLFSDSLLCLDAKTGKRIWHYQVIHHDIWDYDLPTAPVLLDVTVNGRRVKAVAQASKQAFLYVFDRVTGQPLWPIEEKPVPQSDVPTEKSWPTQPIPTKPLAYDRQGLTVDDLIDFTPELKAEAVKLASEFKIGPVYTPPIVWNSNRQKGLLKMPGSGGGSNWQGAGADPDTGIIYIPSVTSPIVSSVTHDNSRSDMNYVLHAEQLPRPMGLPISKPPWGRVTAIDLNTGDHLWMIPNGEPPDDVKNNPQLKGVDISKLGWNERAPVLVTKTLLFAGAGTNFRAIDKKTGAVIHSMKLPQRQTGGAMTYSIGGRQFLVVVVSGRDDATELVAYALPR
jgi:quinoprotein glucose dehydrogenase